MTERCNFVVGQKVCYIGPTGNVNRTHEITIPDANAVYTIRSIALLHDNMGGIGVGLLLREIMNPIGKSQLDGTGEAHYPFELFKPLDERSTDIGFAHEILREINEKDPHWAIRERIRELREAEAFENCSAWC